MTATGASTGEGPALSPEDYRQREESITLSGSPAGMGETHELLTLNIGPHHPSTHGVLRLLTTLEGEVVRDIKPIIGYVHTGIEKTAEDKAYWKVIPVVERMDYLSYYFNAMAFCGAVETLLDVEVPPRAQYLRVIHLELNRIASHLVWLGTSALDLGAISMFWYAFRERELILDLFEMSSGQRMHTRYFQVGGVMEDIPQGFERKLREFLKIMPGRADQYADMLEKNQIVLERLLGTCPLDKETLIELGVTGPLLRAAGEPWDLRKAHPYSSYDHFDFKIPVGTVGRQLRPLSGPSGRVLRVVQDHRAGARRPARGAAHHHRSQGRAPSASRAGHKHGGADPPLQARHRGLPRPARARRTTRSRARAESSGALSAPTGRPSQRACTCAIRASSTSRRWRRWSRTATSRT